LDSERGVQLASLLKRIAAVSSAAPRHIGLSATIGDLALARQWLRPAAPDNVRVIESSALGNALKLQIRGIEEPSPSGEEDDELRDSRSSSADIIAQQLFVTLRGKGNHLVFAGSRAATETYADRLRLLCDEAGVPNEFFPHHGNLSRDMRESLEHRLKEGALPTTAVATTTLELGVDIGSVESVVQIGAPASLSSLRQRLGRSGRREGTAAILRIYTRESEIDEHTSLFDRLRVETVQAIAAIRLLLARWVEPPARADLHFSTMLHQTLSTIVQQGGADAASLYRLLAGSGPFASITPARYGDLLRAMAQQTLIEQAPDGTLMCGSTGERLSSNYDFYSVFVTQEEFALIAKGKTLGTLSVVNVLGPDDYVIFAGRRWKVCEVDDRGKRIMVEPAPSGRVPKFEGEAAPIHDRLAQEIFSVYRDNDVPMYLDLTAQRHLEEGRQAFRDLGLVDRSIIDWNGRAHAFPWLGTRKLDTLRLALRYTNCICDQGRIAISVSNKSATELTNIVKSIESRPPSADELAVLAETLLFQKFDRYLNADLLRQGFMANRIEAEALPSISQHLLAHGTSEAPSSDTSARDAGIQK
jgi:ATP-dependent Lhr-like helicase